MLFETDADKDRLWDIYLNSFPDGTNPIYKVRREYEEDLKKMLEGME